MSRELALCLSIVTTFAVFQPFAFAQTQPPIVKPGAPGEATKVVSPDEAANLSGIRFSAADVRFMQEMLSNHEQALKITGLANVRGEKDAVRNLAKELAGTLEGDVGMMKEWLTSRGQELEAPPAQDGRVVPGMAKAEDISRIEEAKGLEFDRQFLSLIIQNQRGAATMAENLLAEDGAAQDAKLFEFASDLKGDRSLAIERMDVLLADLSPDPRVHLKAGFRDAGEAAWNLEKVATLENPGGFFDPLAPAGMPIPPERKPTKIKDEEDPMQRPGLLSFANTDLAFRREMVIEGNYHGFNFFNIEDPRKPQLLASVVCPGGQGDVSIYQNLLFMSVEETRGRLDCGTQGVVETKSKERFRGVRIFDISDIRMPKQVAAVQTCRGSHTHTLVSDPDDQGNLYVYASGTGSVRPKEELAECSDATADPNTALFSVDVIQVPLAHPENARVVSRPRIFADPETGAIAGLWRGGDHGPGTQETYETNMCHDITVFPEIGLAAGACSGNGILLDIRDPAKPFRIDQVTDPTFAYWHSATFNNDGTKVIFTDEWGGGGRPRCRASDPKNWGADAIFDVVDRKLQFQSYYKMPAPQTEQENCVAHNGSLISVPGRDIMVQAWYQGGISVFDFTDSSNPVEIAFFDRGPIMEKQMVLGGYWSAYWYDGFIYGTEIARGLDVLKLLPSEYLTANEIEAASSLARSGFNAQQQRRIDWPSSPVVARAYLDQLGRTKAIRADRARALNSALDRAGEALSKSRKDFDAASRLDSLAADLKNDSAAATGRDQARIRSLVDTVTGIAKSLR
ncbi:MAG TPA: DUF305 domain-containing protein [Vicinamibacteria bacterium]|nr:DUF305 domain-containing protein [Vicinamibacteria bacterium]